MSETSAVVVRVVRGSATAEEVAALVAVLAFRAAAAPAPVVDVSDAPGWGIVRAGLTPGPGAWRASAREPGVRTRAAW